MKSNDNIMTIPIGKITVSDLAARRWENPGLFAELCNSVRENGVIEPIIARKIGNGYELIKGKRIFLAAKKVGISFIPAIIKEISDKDAIILMLLENTYHEKLNPFDEALLIVRLIKDFKMSINEIAKKRGMQEKTITNKVRLASVCEYVQRLVFEGKLSLEIAYKLADHPEKKQKELADIAVANNLTEEEFVDYARRGSKKRHRHYVRSSSASPASGIKVVSQLSIINSKLADIAEADFDSEEESLPKIREIISEIKRHAGAIQKKAERELSGVA
jgi:ParB family chromosome partitioning protein